MSYWSKSGLKLYFLGRQTDMALDGAENLVQCTQLWNSVTWGGAVRNEHSRIPGIVLKFALVLPGSIHYNFECLLAYLGPYILSIRYIQW